MFEICRPSHVTKIENTTVSKLEISTIAAKPFKKCSGDPNFNCLGFFLSMFGGFWGNLALTQEI